MRIRSVPSFILPIAIITLVCSLPSQHPLLGQATEPSPQTPTLQVTTRMVSVEVVAKDKQGHIVPGLTADDFQIYEQVPPKKDERLQEIKQFQVVSPQAIQTASREARIKLPAGVFSNLVTTRLPVPPTILLLDGLNTEADAGMQARRQMVKMLASIPPETPVAVFLLGHELLLLQNFTTDSRLLRDAAQQVMTSTMDAGGVTIDPHEDPFSLANQTLAMFGGDDEAPPSTVAPSTGRNNVPAAVATGPPGGELQMAEIRRFEKETFAANTDMRVNETLDALRAIARHLSGYPGRKNLIWVSSSFPLTISPDLFDTHHMALEGTRNYESQVIVTTNALADAKVAVYPVNPAGVQTQAFFSATRPPDMTLGPRHAYSEGHALQREGIAEFSGIESMQEVAKQTGGTICVDNNDLGDCVRTAVDEGSSYYELSYYPSASDWRGEFHRITVKSKRPGVQLSYRTGYFATEKGTVEKEKDKKGKDAQLQEAACQDLLTATSLLVVGRALPADSPNQVKFYLTVDTHLLAAADGGDGNREVRLDFTACTFDRFGKALQYFPADSVTQRIDAKTYASLRGFPHMLEFAPRPGTVRIRLLVHDSNSGQFGSLDLPYAAPAATSTANGAQAVARPQ